MYETLLGHARQNLPKLQAQAGQSKEEKKKERKRLLQLHSAEAERCSVRLEENKVIPNVRFRSLLSEVAARRLMRFFAAGEGVLKYDLKGQVGLYSLRGCIARSRRKKEGAVATAKVLLDQGRRLL